MKDTEEPRELEQPFAAGTAIEAAPPFEDFGARRPPLRKGISAPMTVMMQATHPPTAEEMPTLTLGYQGA